MAKKAGRKQLDITERYNRYLAQLSKREASLRKRLKVPTTTPNLTPYTQKQFEEAYSGRLSEYTGKANAKYTNTLKQVVSAQLYSHTTEEAQLLRSYANSFDIDVKKYNITKLRADPKAFGELLSKLNTQLKATGYADTGTKRANFISYSIFGS